MQKIWKIKYLIIDKVKILIIEPHLKKEKSSKMEDFSDFSSSLEDFRLKRNIFGNNEGTAEAVLLNENNSFEVKSSSSSILNNSFYYFFFSPSF